jgi:hypothetical protein
MYCARRKDIEGESETLTEEGEWAMWREGKK